MTGPEHYKEAERLLSAASPADGRGVPAYLHTALVGEATAHAILALTAATVAGRELGPERSDGWREFELQAAPMQTWGEVTDP